MKEALEYLKSCGTFYLATSEDEQRQKQIELISFEGQCTSTL